MIVKLHCIISVHAVNAIVHLDGKKNTYGWELLITLNK